MSDAQNTGRLGAKRLEIACKVASIVLFVAAFMLAAVGAVHLAVLPGIIEPHLRNVAIEMALLALLLAVASTAVGVMGIMLVCRNYDAKRLFLASSGLVAFAIVGVLLAKFVIRGIFGMGSSYEAWRARCAVLGRHRVCVRTDAAQEARGGRCRG